MPCKRSWAWAETGGLSGLRGRLRLCQEDWLQHSGETCMAAASSCANAEQVQVAVRQLKAWSCYPAVVRQDCAAGKSAELHRFKTAC